MKYLIWIMISFMGFTSCVHNTFAAGKVKSKVSVKSNSASRIAIRVEALRRREALEVERILEREALALKNTELKAVDKLEIEREVIEEVDQRSSVPVETESSIQ